MCSRSITASVLIPNHFQIAPLSENGVGPPIIGRWMHSVYRGIPGLFIENEWLELNFLQHESPGRHAGHKDKKSPGKIKHVYMNKAHTHNSNNNGVQ
jgi:hypothetical protein